ncbi:uncharacterized protein [Nicotiana sylvestris]|uniref:uncharacterized protein isoform X9 n=1 Tax=Nicotiana sylvestris TaxID=4096 RepID=UPI00388CC29C
MKSRGPYKKIQGGDGQEVQDLTRSLCMSLGEVISHTPVHQQLSHLHKDLSSLLECFTSIAQVFFDVTLRLCRYPVCWRLYCNMPGSCYCRVLALSLLHRG